MSETSRRWIVLAVGVVAVMALSLSLSTTLRTGTEVRAKRPSDAIWGGCRPPVDEERRSSRAVVPSAPKLPEPSDPAIDGSLVDLPPEDDGEADAPIVDTAVVPVTVRSVELAERYVLPGSGRDGDPVGPVISTQGTWIAWEQRGAGGPDLYAAALTSDGVGTPHTVPVPDQGRRESDAWRRPSWSPNGTLLFEGDSADGVPRIYGAAPGAAAAELISTVEQPGRLSGAAVSPDGAWLAFVADTHGNGDIRLRDPNGAILSLSITDASEDRPRFDAAGRRLVYEREGREVVVADLATRAEQAVLGGPGSRLRPVFAGDEVVYFRQLTGTGSWSLVSAEADASADRILATDVRLPTTAAPAISADGEWAALTWAELARSGVVTMVHVGTGAAIDVRTGMYDVADPALAARDGRWVLAFTAREQPAAGGRLLVVGQVDTL